MEPFLATVGGIAVVCLAVGAFFGIGWVIISIINLKETSERRYGYLIKLEGRHSDLYQRVSKLEQAKEGE